MTLVTLVTLVIMTFCQQTIKQTMATQSPFRNQEQGDALIKGSTDFALKLYRQLAAAGGNVFFSPTSVSIALAMTYLGAREQSAAQIKQVLGLSEVEEEHLHTSFSDLHDVLTGGQEHFTLKLANKLYSHHQYNFLQEYIDRTKTHYKAQSESVNFGDDAARLAINAWVEDQTNNKIQNLLADPLGELTRLVLVNAIYFKGQWNDKFVADKTTVEKFHLSSGGVVDVNMMHSKKKFNLTYIEEVKSRVLELPYVGGDLSMLIILPDESQQMATLESNLKAEMLTELQFGRFDKVQVELSLPRFKLDQSAALNVPLQSLGMQHVFDESCADLSGMDGTHLLYLSNVVHKAYIEVNEEGSEAAAATAAVVMTRSMPRPPEQFMADRPFLFLIKDCRTKAVLFMGKLAQPSPATVKEEL